MRNVKTVNIWFKLFSSKTFIGNNGSQNIFVYQPKLDMLALEKGSRHWLYS